MKLKELAVFSRQFATMVNSGLPILRALSILADQTSNAELARVLGEVRIDVEQGASLSGAMAKHPKVFNDLFVSMVKSGETGGSLDDVLLRLADMIENEVKLRGKIKSAMTYPIAVVALVVLIMSAMLLFVVPQFQTIYAQLGGSPAAADAGPARRCRTSSRSTGTSCWSASFVVRFFFKRWKKTAEGPRGRRPDEAQGAGVRRRCSTRRRCRGSPRRSAMLLHSGVPILQALEIVIETVNNKVVVEGDRATCSRASARASRWPSRSRSTRCSRRWSCRCSRSARRPVRSTRCSRRSRTFYDQEVEAAVDALTSLIEPLLIAVIGGCVGAAVVALYMPMFNIIKLIQ